MPSFRRTARGATLLEAAFFLGVAAVVIVGALGLGDGMRLALAPIGEAARLAPRLEAMRYAVPDWYRARHCGTQRLTVDGFPVDIDQDDAAAACAADPIDCVAKHVPPHLADYATEVATEDGEFGWAVRGFAPPEGPVPEGFRWPRPLLRLFWTPAERFGERTYPIARELEAFCDDDSDAATRETCDGEPAGERLVWEQTLRSQGARGLAGEIRLREWLAANAVNCDGDDNGVLDPYCDGIIVDGDIEYGPHLDLDGDGCSDVRPAPATDPVCHNRRGRAFIDLDADGDLDLDATGDFIVDAADYHALGC